MAEGSSEPKLAELVLVLKAVDWHSLGIQLDIEKSKLDEIDDQFSLKQIDRKRADMFGYWLDNEEYPTWEMIVKALEKMGGCNRAIRTIRSEYLNATKPDSSIQSASSSTTPRSSARDYSRPSLPLLEKFEDLKILERIGPDYMKFGVQLLLDDTGNRVNEIERQYQRDSTDIKMQIAREWLNGKGMPLNWHSLVEVLYGMDKRVLAEDIVQKLQSKGVEISIEEFDV